MRERVKERENEKQPRDTEIEAETSRDDKKVCMQERKKD